MNPSTFSQYVTGKQRPFVLFMYLTANHLMENPNMKLGPMRQDFGYMAKALKDRIASEEFKSPGTIFFAEAEYHESQEVRPWPKKLPLVLRKQFKREHMIRQLHTL